MQANTKAASYQSVVSGEIAGSATAAQMPDIPCRMVIFKATATNAGKVYIGGAGVTKPDGTGDATTGWELAAGDPSPWFPVDNLKRFYYICDNAGDDLVYLAFA